MHRLIGLFAIFISFAAASGYAAETTTYYHHDALGSVVAATDEGGNLLWREDYRPYGERIRKPTNSNNNLWYTGKPEEAQLGLQYFGARWYDPNLGRFTGIDPAGVNGADIHSFNRYAYANNNPYMYVDPDGRASVHPVTLAGEGSYLVTTAVIGVFGLDVWLRTQGSSLYDVWNPRKNQSIVMLNESSESNKDSSDNESNDNVGEAFPDRPLPRDDDGNAVPESENPHTQLGKRTGRKGKYPQAREFDSDGKPVRDIDFTDHGRKHPNPHQHKYRDPKTGGTRQRGPSEELD